MEKGWIWRLCQYAGNDPSGGGVGVAGILGAAPGGGDPVPPFGDRWALRLFGGWDRRRAGESFEPAGGGCTVLGRVACAESADVRRIACWCDTDIVDVGLRQRGGRTAFAIYGREESQKRTAKTPSLNLTKNSRSKFNLPSLRWNELNPANTRYRLISEVSLTKYCKIIENDKLYC